VVLMARIDSFALKCEDTKDAFVDAAKRLLSNKAFQSFHPKSELQREMCQLLCSEGKKEPKLAGKKAKSGLSLGLEVEAQLHGFAARRHKVCPCEAREKVIQRHFVG
jgi:hypothetical protein